MDSLSHFNSIWNDNPFPEELALEKTSNLTSRIILLIFFFYFWGLWGALFFNTCLRNGWSFYIESTRIIISLSPNPQNFHSIFLKLSSNFFLSSRFWDDWMRHPEQRKNRVCIRPEICRTSTFGKQGVSKYVFLFTSAIKNLAMSFTWAMSKNLQNQHFHY